MKTGLTPNLERILLNFASYSSMIGRSGYADILRQTLLLPEPQRSEQLNILKYTISEILTLYPDHSDFRDFVRKFDLSAESIKEFIRFLGPDSGLKYFEDDSEEVFITIPSFMKSKIDEKIYDRVSLLAKIEFGKNYWEEIEFSEMKSEKLSEFLKRIHLISPDLAQYLYNHLS